MVNWIITLSILFSLLKNFIKNLSLYNRILLKGWEAEKIEKVIYPKCYHGFLLVFGFFLSLYIFSNLFTIEYLCVPKNDMPFDFSTSQRALAFHAPIFKSHFSHFREKWKTNVQPLDTFQVGNSGSHSLTYEGL